MKKLLFVLLGIYIVCFLSFHMWSSKKEQEGIYTGIGAIIKKTNTADTTIFTINVNELENENLNEEFGLAEIRLGLRTQNITNLDISLVAPNGEKVELTLNDGINQDVREDIIFSDTAKRLIFTTEKPYGGYYRPHGFIGWFNNICKGKGTWKLKIFDAARKPGRGVLLYWQLKFAKNPPVPKPLRSSTLPLVVINCPEVSPIKKYDAKGSMYVIYNEDGKINKLEDSIRFTKIPLEIKLRGNSSVRLARKNYSLKVLSNKEPEKEFSIAGIRATSQWVLGSNLMDRTIIRNSLTYALYQSIGEPSVENKLCEVVWNNQYMGVYLLSEKPDHSIIQKALTVDKIKEYGKQFVICKDDFNKDQIGWHSDNESYSYNSSKPFLIVKYPEKKKEAKKAKTYIRQYFNKFDDLLASKSRDANDTSYQSMIDFKSFIDYVIINEISKNADGYKLSTYFYRPYEGRLHAGPAWDYDRAYGNLGMENSVERKGWEYLYNDSNATNGAPQWWVSLMKNQMFSQQFKERWVSLRKHELSDAKVNHTIDSLIQITQPVYARNFDLWPVFGIRRHGFHQSAKIKNYDDELIYLREFISERLHWIDQHVNNTTRD